MFPISSGVTMKSYILFCLLVSGSYGCSQHDFSCRNCLISGCQWVQTKSLITRCLENVEEIPQKQIKFFIDHQNDCVMVESFTSFTTTRRPTTTGTTRKTVVKVITPANHPELETSSVPPTSHSKNHKFGGGITNSTPVTTRKVSTRVETFSPVENEMKEDESILAVAASTTPRGRVQWRHTAKPTNQKPTTTQRYHTSSKYDNDTASTTPVFNNMNISSASSNNRTWLEKQSVGQTPWFTPTSNFPRWDNTIRQRENRLHFSTQTTRRSHIVNVNNRHFMPTTINPKVDRGESSIVQYNTTLSSSSNKTLIESPSSSKTPWFTPTATFPRLHFSAQTTRRTHFVGVNNNRFLPTTTIPIVYGWESGLNNNTTLASLNNKTWLASPSKKTSLLNPAPTTPGSDITIRQRENQSQSPAPPTRRSNIVNVNQQHFVPTTTIPRVDGGEKDLFQYNTTPSSNNKTSPEKTPHHRDHEGCKVEEKISGNNTQTMNWEGINITATIFPNFTGLHDCKYVSCVALFLYTRIEYIVFTLNWKLLYY